MGDIDELNFVYEIVYEDNLDMLDNLSMESMNMSTEEESWDATADMWVIWNNFIKRIFANVSNLNEQHAQLLWIPWSQKS